MIGDESLEGLRKPTLSMDGKSHSVPRRLGRADNSRLEEAVGATFDSSSSFDFLRTGTCFACQAARNVTSGCEADSLSFWIDSLKPGMLDLNPAPLKSG
jgi:hypothetical protein